MLAVTWTLHSAFVHTAKLDDNVNRSEGPLLISIHLRHAAKALVLEISCKAYLPREGAKTRGIHNQNNRINTTKKKKKMREKPMRYQWAMSVMIQCNAGKSKLYLRVTVNVGNDGEVQC